LNTYHLNYRRDQKGPPKEFKEVKEKKIMGLNPPSLTNLPWGKPRWVKENLGGLKRGFNCLNPQNSNQEIG